MGEMQPRGPHAKCNVWRMCSKHMAAVQQCALLKAATTAHIQFAHAGSVLARALQPSSAGCSAARQFEMAAPAEIDADVRSLVAANSPNMLRDMCLQSQGVLDGLQREHPPVFQAWQAADAEYEVAVAQAERLRKRLLEIQVQWQTLSMEWKTLDTDLKAVEAQKQRLFPAVEDLRLASWRHTGQVDMWKHQLSVRMQALRASEDAHRKAEIASVVEGVLASGAGPPPQVWPPGI